MRTPSTTVFLSAAALAAAVTLNAQTPSPQTPNPQTPTTQPQTDRQRPSTDTQRGSEQSVTITGCLKAEKDVPGRSPNVAERAGMNEDYILTNVKMGQGSATSAMGLASMYEVKGVDDSELKKHVNHQVEVVGRLNTSQSGSNTGTAARGTTGGGTTGSTAGGSSPTGTTGAGSTGTTGAGSTAQRGSGAAGSANSNDLPELQATSIRMVAQTCPAQ